MSKEKKVEQPAEPVEPQHTETIEQEAIEETNDNIFDQVDSVEGVDDVSSNVEPVVQENIENTTQQPRQTEMVQPKVAAVEEPAIILGEVEDKISYEVALAPEDEGKKFVIESARILNPRLTNNDGSAIAPCESDTSEAKWYESKIEVLLKDTKYKILIPKIMWFVNKNEKGQTVLNPTFRQKVDGMTTEEALVDKFVSDATKTYMRYCMKYGDEIGVLGLKSFIDNLAGKTIVAKTEKGVYKKKPWTKIVIKEFVE